MKTKNSPLHALFESLLRRMHHAEQDILKQLEVLSGLVKEERFKDGLTKHMKETRFQIERLEKSLRLLKVDINEKKEGFLENTKEVLEKGKEVVSDMLSSGFIPKSPALQGIVKEGKEVFDDFKDTDVHDLVLSAGAQSIEMGEIASYKTLCQLAEQIGYTDILEMLQRSLKEEENQADLVSKITQQEIKKLKKAA